ncbi:probable LRR receptor-like serine/threonine-protein kinase At3g47570 [Salvia miltiorrhiza]|uniref:probable LRR receptor-like serine/threonine-protein kinase At3g47570 n=1 Tax=Salvia miltiorrhiza TaxID=226208 RepID=UPI0025ACDADF|nr:probable LRR receptor-like serine/threonine-protein kinase At3g47570 [Salvia miltiorrhiza]
MLQQTLKILLQWLKFALNLSFNDLEGALPQGGVFKNASAISVAGNPKLCGGVPELRLPKCNLKKSNLKLKIVMISTTILALAIIVGGALVFCCLKRRRPPPPSNPFANPLLQVSYQTLSQATVGFSEEILLGAGSYGAVYRGALGEDEKLVTVKVLNLSQRGAVRSFVAECEALRNIRHGNLVKVVTACSDFDMQGNDLKALVYEFMPNGSLDDWLHEEDQRRGRARRLGLAQRVSIAIDVACALDPIIHCDIKPSNVLLDDDLVGHVGDLGLARFLTKATTHQQRHHWLHCSSFGILLLEMFSGRRPTDEMLRDGFGIHSFVGKCLVEEAKEVVDPWLLTEMEDAVRFSIGDRDQSFMEHHKLDSCSPSETVFVLLERRPTGDDIVGDATSDPRLRVLELRVE